MESSSTFIQRAIELAAGNARAGRGGPFGAVVVRDGTIIAEGTNVVTATNDPTAHAEVMAIRDACRRLGSFELRGCELYASCEPCPMCLGAIYWARLDRVYIASTRAEAASAGFDDSFIYEQVATPPDARAIPMIHLPHADHMTPFEAWARAENRTLY